ncbi:cytochrome P450 [Streptomyces sp. NPDC054796]
MSVTADVVPPSSSIDLFADAALRDPHPLHETLREMGPAVYLHKHGAWAIPRYEEARAVLKDAATFSSDGGIALTEEANEHILTGTVLASDAVDHARLRRPLSRQLNQRAMRKLTAPVEERAEQLVAEHLRYGSFDAVALARQFVADIVMDLMGLPASTRARLIDGAAATFECFGPDNARYRQAAPVAAAVITFLHQEVTRHSVAPGSWMAALYQAADAGQITETDVVPLMSAYVAAGMDTTIFALSTAIHLLATHPEQWTRLRTGKISAQAVMHESLRLEAPVQGFGRRVTRTTRIGGIPIKADEQVWVLYGSAGRDPRRWGPTADSFDPTRARPEDHLAFGAGPHLCAGNHLAALESRSLLTALTRHCTHLEPDGEPVRALNNTLRGHISIPVKAALARSPTTGPDGPPPAA